MSRPLLLDLFCGAGGAAVGYHRAGFDVVGVDIKPQPRYPFEFVQMDAMEVLDWRSPTFGFPVRFDAIHASPPCQAYAVAATTRKRDDHPDLLLPTRHLLEATGLPWVIENIPTAPMPGGFLLCGSGFGLPIVRHRRFWTSFDISMRNATLESRLRTPARDHAYGAAPYAQGSWEARWAAEVLPSIWPWMTLDEAGQAIPSAYTEWIGAALLRSLALEGTA